MQQKYKNFLYNNTKIKKAGNKTGFKTKINKNGNVYFQELAQFTKNKRINNFIL